MEGACSPMPKSMLRRVRMTSGCHRKSPPRHRRKRKSSFRAPRPSPRPISRRGGGTHSAARMKSGKESRLFHFPGHTPGHTGYEFSSKGQRILFWGDVIHTQSVQLKHPEVSVAFDIDPAAAVATRNKVLTALVDGKVLVAGPHMAFPGAGRLRKDG